MDRREHIVQRAQQVERVMHKYSSSEDRKRDYGTGELLSRKEIHTIRCIGDTPGINLKTLTARQGVTKGAASQMVSRLADKGLVSKARSGESEAEIRLTLTESGNIAYNGHIQYHHSLGSAWYERFAVYTDEQLNTFFSILTDIEELIDKNI